jgi:hypothetical protein
LSAGFSIFSLANRYKPQVQGGRSVHEAIPVFQQHIQPRSCSACRDILQQPAGVEASQPISFKSDRLPELEIEKTIPI